ncbi:hypothetical protein L1887_33924 [Cichorium endivia]|nr:hypothetical protein L1887_33924 [Cichorium endivia]
MSVRRRRVFLRNNQEGGDTLPGKLGFLKGSHENNSKMSVLEKQFVFHSHCPQTARMYYHPPAENHPHGGNMKTINGGNGGGAEVSSKTGFTNPAEVILYSAV